jgi:hypothetical protein
VRPASLVLVLVAACGGGGPGPGDPDAGTDQPDADNVPADELDTATGCAGVYNPDQLLAYRITMASGDWAALRADATNSVYYPADLACGDEPPITVGIRRKRSGGTVKVGLKIDVNYYAPDQRFHDLHKLSLENGISEGGSTASARELVAEYLAWRLMIRSGAIGSRVAFASVEVNGEAIGLYVNVEQPDKRFLRSRVGEDDGWLFKKSGGVDDGYKTNELEPNPSEPYFCFWMPPGCPIPSSDALLAELPARLDIPQLLRLGAANAIMANTDGILFKDNNYYFYDPPPGGRRLYLAWDLDTTLRDNPDAYTPNGTSAYTEVLYTHWDGDYRAIVGQLLAGPYAVAEIEAELDRAASVAGAALDADLYVEGDAADAIAQLAAYWANRHAAVLAQSR